MFWGKAKEQKVTTIRPKNKLFFFKCVRAYAKKSCIIMFGD